MFTSPVAVPGSDPIREIGSIVTDSGGRGGVTVTVVCWLTAVVGRRDRGDGGRGHGRRRQRDGPGPDTPRGRSSSAGRLTAGELLERLTTAPPAGAGPGRFNPGGGRGAAAERGRRGRDVLQRRRQHGELARGRDAVERGGDRHGRRGRDLPERDLEIAPAERPAS